MHSELVQIFQPAADGLIDIRRLNVEAGTRAMRQARALRLDEFFVAQHDGVLAAAAEEQRVRREQEHTARDVLNRA